MDNDDLIDEMFEYDMVMNDGKWFSGKEPKGSGCLTACIGLVIVMLIIGALL